MIAENYYKAAQQVGKYLILQKGFVCGNNRGKCVSGDDLLHPYLKINHLFSCKRSCRNRLVYKNVTQNDIIITDFHVVLSLYAMTMRIVKTGALLPLITINVYM